LKIPVRYTARGEDQVGELEVPVDEVALVMVDLWNWHDPEDEREEPPKYLRHAEAWLGQCREAGMTIIHAPNWPVTHRYAQHEALEAEADQHKESRNIPEHMAWPPRQSDIRDQAAGLRSGHELNEVDRKAMMDKRTISRYVQPIDGELMISTNNAFRYALWQRGIKLLIYIGGALNECMLHRDTSLNYIVGSDSGKSNLVVVVLEDCVYSMPSGGMSDEETKAAMLNYYRRKIAFTACSSELTL
jgi:nicotinamidase-related amidase